jgi:stage II sporulation SpoAA-like protein
VIELLKEFPDNVVALAFHGHVTKADYDEVLVADFEDRLARHKKVRIYLEVAPDFTGLDPGAVWEDTRFGFGHFFDWDRCALVSDVEWVKHVAKFSEFFGFLWPGEYRAFPEAEAGKAREWIAEPQH